MDSDGPTDGDSIVVESDLMSKFENAMVTESGVKYVFLEEGTGKNLVPGEKIRFHYVGKLTDGTQFESSYDYGEPYTHVVGSNDVIVGLRDAISNLSVGDIALVHIPSHLAYGDQSTGLIPPNSDLIFQIEIVEVIPKPTMFDTEGAVLRSSGSGLQYYILNETEGEPARVGDIVFIHYTGYLEDGTIFDSSVERGEPYGFQLGVDPMISGWDEGVQLLKVGEKAQLIIPPEIGYGERGNGPIPPNATIIFDIELVSVQKL